MMTPLCYCKVQVFYVLKLLDFLRVTSSLPSAHTEATSVAKAVLPRLRPTSAHGRRLLAVLQAPGETRDKNKRRINLAIGLLKLTYKL